MAVNTVAAGDPVASADHNALAGLFNGTTGYGEPAKFYELNDATAYSVIAGNQDTTNGYAFKAQYGTLSGTPTTLATIAKGGVALMPSSTELGMKVQSTGRIGVFDSVSVDLLAATTPFSMTRTNALGEVMADFQLRSTMPGTQVTTGTAASGTNTTLTVAGTPWTVNAYAGKIVHLLTGTGASAADPYRYVVSNTNNTLTIDSDVVWTTNPGAGTTFEILTPGDIGAARFLMEAKSGSVAARRAIEAHAFAQTGAADSGTTAIEVSFGSNAAQFDPNNNVGISIAASAAWLTGNVGVEQGTHLRLWGGLGSARYVACENASGTLEASIYKGGLGNFGANTAGVGTARLNVHQASGDATGSGFRVYPNNVLTSYGEAFVDGNKALNFGVVQSGVGSASALLSGNPGVDTFTLSAPQTLSQNLLTLAVSNVGTKFAVTYDASLLVGLSHTAVGGGAGVLAIKNAATNPSSNPSGGGILYADAGAGKWRGSGGTTTTFGAAEPHCPTCDRDFALEWESPRYGYISVCVWCMTDAIGNAGVMKKLTAEERA